MQDGHMEVAQLKREAARETTSVACPMQWSQLPGKQELGSRVGTSLFFPMLRIIIFLFQLDIPLPGLASCGLSPEWELWVVQQDAFGGRLAGASGIDDKRLSGW